MILLETAISPLLGNASDAISSGIALTRVSLIAAVQEY